jgi:hypothetical protein
MRTTADCHTLIERAPKSRFRSGTDEGKTDAFAGWRVNAIVHNELRKTAIRSTG